MLILYATKHGAAREAAQRIAQHIPGAAVHDLKQSGLPSLEGFDRVVIGSSIYVGAIHKEAKAFLSSHAQALREKKLGLFLCGLNADEEKTVFEANFPQDILHNAASAVFLGGTFDPKKAGAVGRLVMKVAAKQAGPVDTIDDDKIRQFAEVMRT